MTRNPDSSESFPAGGKYAAAVLRREGEYWAVGYDGRLFRLKDSKGLDYLATLLRHPGTEFHAFDLMTGAAAGSGAAPGRPPLERMGADQLEELGLSKVAVEDAGEMLDAEAKASYRRRLGELREELEEAKELGKVERGEQIEAEIEALTKELSRAAGIGGRDRRAGSTSERARLNVSRAIKSVLDRIAESDAELGRHLQESVRTGTFCCYEPGSRAPIDWQINEDPRSAAAFHPPGPAAVLKVVKTVTAVRQPSHNLPAQLTSFIGREAEIAEVKRLLDLSRLLTLTGSGGCGKTRLALETARRIADQYPDGVRLVELAALADPTLVAQTVALAFGLRDEGGQPITERLCDFLRARTTLLVLDNCEHLLKPCAELVELLLKSCANVKALATSREGLAIAGEMNYRVPSLTMPDLNALRCADGELISGLNHYEATRLFAERAAFADPNFRLTASNALAVAQICQRLEGIALAIELAAVRVKALTPQQIAEHLDDRFRLLTGGARTAMARQQTLRASIDWTHELLSEPERVMLRRLSVFAGGWTLEAAEQVCAGEGIEQSEVLDLLAKLVDKSLVIASEHGSAACYRMLETVRQYGSERLEENGESAAVCNRHLDFFLRLAEEAARRLCLGVSEKPAPYWRAVGELETPHPWSAERRLWLARLDLEHDNLRAALQWSRTADGEKMLRLAVGLHELWSSKGLLTEGRGWLEEALRLAPQRNVVRSQALFCAGLLATFQGEWESARSQLEQSAAIASELGLPYQLVGSLALAGVNAAQHGNSDAALVSCERALSVARQTGDKGPLAFASLLLAAALFLLGDYSRARRLLEDCQWLSEVGHPYGRALVLEVSGLLAWQAGNLGAAQSAFEEALAVRRANCDLAPQIAQDLDYLAAVAHQQGELQRAATLAAESLTIYRDSGVKRGVVRDLNLLARVALGQRLYAPAARLFAAVEPLRGLLRGSVLIIMGRDTQDIAAVRAALGEEAFAAAWAEGRAMTLEQAIEFALA